MANKAKSTQGTKLEASLTSGTGASFTKIANATAVPRGTGSAQWTDVTNFDTVDAKEYIPALDDVSDANVTGQRIVDDAGQNMLRDAYYSNPRTLLYFRATTAQGEVFLFSSYVGGWSVTGESNAAEMFSLSLRPLGETSTLPQTGG